MKKQLKGKLRLTFRANMYRRVEPKMRRLDDFQLNCDEKREITKMAIETEEAKSRIL